jgi:hypothetical protein
MIFAQDSCIDSIRTIVVCSLLVLLCFFSCYIYFFGLLCVCSRFFVTTDRERIVNKNLRFNLTADTELIPNDQKQELQIVFNNGRWICLSLADADETATELAKRLTLRKSGDNCSLSVEIDDIVYDTTGRCQLIQFNYRHRSELWSFEDAVEQWHTPGPALSRDEL